MLDQATQQKELLIKERDEWKYKYENYLESTGMQYVSYYLAVAYRTNQQPAGKIYPLKLVLQMSLGCLVFGIT